MVSVLMQVAEYERQVEHRRREEKEQQQLT